RSRPGGGGVVGTAESLRGVVPQRHHLRTGARGADHRLPVGRSFATDRGLPEVGDGAAVVDYLTSMLQSGRSRSNCSTASSLTPVLSRNRNDSWENRPS